MIARQHQAAGKTRSMKVGDVSYPCRHDSIFGGDIFRDPIRDFDGARTRQAMPAGNRDPAHDAGPSQLTTRTTAVIDRRRPANATYRPDMSIDPPFGATARLCLRADHL
jgi:hypothetical protein